jgi:DegV family protein with EDD domain
MVKILTDSACDLTHEMIKELDVEVISLIVTLDNKEWSFSENTVPEDFWAAVKKSAEIPKTSMLSHEQLDEAFRKWASAADEVLFISMTSKGSGTYDNACVVQKELAKEGITNIFVHDSMGYTNFEGIQVYKAVKMVEAGKNAQEVCSELAKIVDKRRSAYALIDLKYIKRGGRMSAGAALIGGFLNIIPLVTIKEGTLVPIAKERGQKKAMENMINRIKNDIDADSKEFWVVGCDADEAVKTFCELLEATFENAEITVVKTFDVTSTHAGPGLFGVTWQGA